MSLASFGALLGDSLSTFSGTFSCIFSLFRGGLPGGLPLPLPRPFPGGRPGLRPVGVVIFDKLGIDGDAEKASGFHPSNLRGLSIFLKCESDFRSSSDFLTGDLVGTGLDSLSLSSASSRLVGK